MAGFKVFKEKLLVFFGTSKLFLDEFVVYQCAFSFADPIQIIGVWPVGGVRYQTIFDGVAVDITTKM